MTMIRAEILSSVFRAPKFERNPEVQIYFKRSLKYPKFELKISLENSTRNFELDMEFCHFESKSRTL